MKATELDFVKVRQALAKSLYSNHKITSIQWQELGNAALAALKELGYDISAFTGGNDENAKD